MKQGEFTGLRHDIQKKIADNLNEKSRIGCMCPSVMISGAGNFPVKKKEKQNAASDRNYKEFQEIQKILDKIRSIANGRILSNPETRTPWRSWKRSWPD